MNATPVWTDAEAAVNYVIALADVSAREVTVAAIATGSALICDADTIAIGLWSVKIQNKMGGNEK